MVTTAPEELKRQKAHSMRYKRAALDSLSLEYIRDELNEMSEKCATIQYMMDTEGDEVITEALDGDEEESFEFKMMFSDLSYHCDQLFEALSETSYDKFDDTLVALVGRTQRLVGYDGYQESYYSLGHWEQELAHTESGKRLMRLTKSDMLSEIGVNLSLFMGFLDLRQKYDYLHATLEILTGENRSILENLKRIDELYEQANAVGFNSNEIATQELERLLRAVPDRMWIE